MLHYLFSLVIYLVGGGYGDVIDIKEPKGDVFSYELVGSQVSSEFACSYKNFYLIPEMSLPSGFGFEGSHYFTYGNNRETWPHVLGGDPAISAYGYQFERRTEWPVNPVSRHLLGLHWLCGRLLAKGSYRLSVPKEIKLEIKLRRTDLQRYDSPDQLY